MRLSQRLSAAALLLLVPLRGSSALPGLPGLEEKAEFAWLEDGKDPKVLQWAEAKNAAAREALRSLSGRGAITERLEAWNGVGTIKDSLMRGRRLFYLKRSGLENQPVLYVKDDPRSPGRAVLDVNRLSADGATALDWWVPSPDGLLLAYGLLGKSGEETVAHVREVDSGIDFPDAIPRTRRASLAWLPDRSGFFYTKYAKDAAYRRMVYFHPLGGDPIKDEYVFGRGRAIEDWPDVSVSPQGGYLLVSVSEGASKTELYVRSLRRDTTAFMEVTSGKDAAYQGEIDGDTLYLRTNEGAPRGKIMAVTLKMPFKVLSMELMTNARKRAFWRELVPESPFTIADFHLAGGRLLLHVLERSASRLRLHALDGAPLREIPLPGLGTVSSFTGEPGAKSLAFVFESFFTPPALYSYDIARSSLAASEALAAPPELSDFESSQVTYESKDATPVTMFLLRKKRMRRDENNPTLLAGGGAGDSRTPTFNPSLMLWLEKGGLYALPNVRGGGEYGEAWRKAGRLGQKQNAFDDFIAAGLWLARGQYTRPRRLAAMGDGAGGLLAGAAVTQAPELFMAAMLGDPILDMLRYDQFPPGRLWTAEYGSPDDPAANNWLRAYSPCRRVQKDVAYPAVLFLSGETDPRFDPMHARKMAALLEKNSSSFLPILLRLAPKARGAEAKPLSQTIAEWTDRYSFLFWQLGVN